MSATLWFEVDPRPLHRVGADVLVVPYVASQGLVRGPLAWADWRMCGLLTEALRLQAEDDPEAVLLAPTRGRLRAGWVLALGLADGIGEEGLRRAGERILERVRALKLGRFAVALPAGGDPARVAEALAVGLMAGLVRRPASLEARLVVPSDLVRQARSGLERAAKAPLPGIVLQLRAPADPIPRPVGRPAHAPAPDPR